MVRRVQTNVVSIVDDNPPMLQAVDRLLRASGYSTELFASGVDFLNGAASSAATCLVIDIHLGDMSGIDLARRLAARGFAAPIIFMSATVEPATRKAAIDAGCVALLHKPFPAGLLLKTVSKALQTRA